MRIEWAKAKAWLRMPATRLEKRGEKEKKPKAELFPCPEQRAIPAGDAELLFSNPAISPALKKLREMLRRDSVNEAELIGILRESSPDQTLLLSSFEEIQARTSELCVEGSAYFVAGLCSLGRVMSGAELPRENLPPAKPYPPLPKQKFIVGLTEGPPFNIRKADGTWTGISVQLWRQIAKELGLEYEFRET